VNLSGKISSLVVSNFVEKVGRKKRGWKGVGGKGGRKD